VLFTNPIRLPPIVNKICMSLLFAIEVGCDGPVIYTKSKHRYGRQESMYWWPKYKKIKLRKKEELRGRRPLNTGGTKLSEVRWPKATCAVCRSRNIGKLANSLRKSNGPTLLLK
jgi:hypothetical protein